MAQTVGDTLVVVALTLITLGGILFAFLLVAVPLCFVRMLPYALSIYLVYLLACWLGAL